MAIESIVLAVVVLGMAVGLLLLRVPIFAALFSLLVGQVLSAQASSDVYGFLASLSGFLTYQYVQAGLLILPLALTVFFLKGRMDKSRIIFEAIPALFVGVTALLLLYPLLPFIANFLDMGTEGQIKNFRSLALIVASVLGLVSVWISVPKKHVEGKHHEK